MPSLEGTSLLANGELSPASLPPRQLEAILKFGRRFDAETYHSPHAPSQLKTGNPVAVGRMYWKGYRENEPLALPLTPCRTILWALSFDRQAFQPDDATRLWSFVTAVLDLIEAAVSGGETEDYPRVESLPPDYVLEYRFPEIWALRDGEGGVNGIAQEAGAPVVIHDNYGNAPRTVVRFRSEEARLRYIARRGWAL